MEAAFVIAVALGVAIVVVLLGLVATLLYYRWRIGDNRSAEGRSQGENVHLKKFFDKQSD